MSVDCPIFRPFRRRFLPSDDIDTRDGARRRDIFTRRYALIPPRDALLHARRLRSDRRELIRRAFSCSTRRQALIFTFVNNSPDARLQRPDNQSVIHRAICLLPSPIDC
ncbi:hypothetical protein AVEN_38827-1 [Araneus ventricosus]|uniref:Uncharacterized protein n=1 Tax=Araneus ventricosus TaxID=182803 RepID=A0A4Y2K380_ARAVE|nr:hypothetical protein AVEN_38827-1 [Araneus ventricosus]